MIDRINGYLYRLQDCIDKLNREEINTLINLLLLARNENRTIFIMGYGGSLKTVRHFSFYFNKGMSFGKDKKFKMICLSDNIATMLAYANDTDYSNVFVEQLKNFFNKGDIVIGISGSGNSKNVLKAIEFANSNGGITIGLTGFNGGILKQIARYSVNTNINDMQITEDIHMMLCHMIYNILTNQKSEIRKELVYDLP